MAAPTFQLAPYKFLLGVAAVAIPVFGVLRVVSGVPESTFEVAMRVALSAVCVVVLIAVQLDRHAARWVRPATLPIAFLIVAWFLVAPGVTVWQGTNVVLISALVVSVFRSRAELLAYLAWTVGATLVSWWLDPAPQMQMSLLLATELVVIPALGTLQLRRVRLEEGLEERVRQRTSDLVESLRRLEHEVEVRRVAELEARQADQAKSTFLATMSHELRTPLTAILGYTELLQEELPDGAAPDLERVRASARQLLQLVDDVLDLARVDAGKVQVHRQPWTVRELVEPAVDEIRAVALQKGLVVRCELDGEAVVVTDRVRVRQILANLLSNAVKFTTAGSVSVVGRVDAERMRVEVTDTGPGLAAETLTRLFQRFVQADPSTTRRFGGTGLGLAICRELAVLLGGDVTVRSTLGEGSTFTLTLPLR